MSTDIGSTVLVVGAGATGLMMAAGGWPELLFHPDTALR
jgi:hypothetical protein